jgi:AcrR family transcriptional regulator
MARRQTRTDDELLAAAVRVVGRLGPGRLTLAEVGREARLSAPALIQRFGSKRGLLLAIASHASDDVAMTFRRARDEAASPLDALVAALGQMAASAGGPDELANHIAFLHLDLSDPEFHDLATRHARAMLREVRLLLDAAEAGGELAPGAAAELTSTVSVVYNGALITWAVSPQGSLRSWVEDHVERALAPFRREGNQ